MLSIGFVFLSIGFILIIFNSINFSFVKNQQKDKRQLIGGIVVAVLGAVLLFISIQNLMQVE
ncbi:MAG: hypothetical protein KAH07_09800 [Flavobacteriaceae bacterium]|nr:hypothetical protein [Flavobacteriaceae bacterium]